MSLFRGPGSLADRFFSDRHRMIKILILAGIYFSLALYFREANPEKGAQWQRIVFRAAAAEANRGRQVSMTLARVVRLLPQGGGAVLEVGWPKVEVAVLGLSKVKPGDMVDLTGPFIDGNTMGVSEVRVHHGSHEVKVWISLIAACAALIYFFRGFKLSPGAGVLFRPRD